MRQQIIEKIEWLYSDKLSLIKECLDEFIGLDFNIKMLSTSLIMEQQSPVYLHNDMGYNSTLVIPEIFEDFSCSLELIRMGYFKNSKQIIRNTQELILQFLYNNILISEGRQSESNWLNKRKGVEKISDLLILVKKHTSNQDKYRITEIGKFFNLLNIPTHSHKNQLNTITTYRFEKFGVFGFEPTEAVNCIAILLCCLDNALFFVKKFYEKYTEDYWAEELVTKVKGIMAKLKVFSKSIDNYKKGDYEKGEGILIFRKNLLLDEKKVLYTYKADYSITYPTRNIGTLKNKKLIFQDIDEELNKKLAN